MTGKTRFWIRYWLHFALLVLLVLDAWRDVFGGGFVWHIPYPHF